MASIAFNLRPEVSSEQRAAVFRHVKALSGILEVARLYPGSDTPAVQRMCFAKVKDAADLPSLLSQIQALPEVESASSPDSATE